MTYFRFYGITKLCDNIGSWSNPTDEHYHFSCPRCDAPYITRNIHIAGNNSGRLTLDPPEVRCTKCDLHLRIKDGEAEIID